MINILFKQNITKRLGVLVLIIALSPITLFNQDKHQKDINTIKEMAGCFDVKFNFIETFNYSKDSSYHPSLEKHSSAIEWVFPIEEKEDKISLQHILLVGNPFDPVVVKHWRQDWLYENTDFHIYHADSKWNYEKKNKDEVKGQWTQKVYQVDDGPRYEGSATWVYVDGKTFWENSTYAPLPRRERTKRNDYNATYRRNRIEVTPAKWIHDQYNDKLIRENGQEDVVLAEEKGYNTYLKLDDSKCKVATEWWNNHKSFWKEVRNKWDDVFSQKKSITIKKEVEEKKLHEHIFELDEKKDNSDSADEIEKTINLFVVSE